MDPFSTSAKSAVGGSVGASDFARVLRSVQTVRVSALRSRNCMIDHCSGWWRRRVDKTAAKPEIAVVDAAECRVTNLLASRGVAALRLTSAWVGRCPE